MRKDKRYCIIALCVYTVDYLHKLTTKVCKCVCVHAWVCTCVCASVGVHGIVHVHCVHIILYTC